MGPTRSLIAVIQRLLILLLTSCQANDNAKRLYDDLLRNSGYNKLIRPVGNNTDKLVVKLGIRLAQLIDIVSTLCLCSSLNPSFYVRCGRRCNRLLCTRR